MAIFTSTPAASTSDTDIHCIAIYRYLNPHDIQPQFPQFPFLPPELRINIASHLSLHDLLQLSRTSRKNHTILSPNLYFAAAFKTLYPDSVDSSSSPVYLLAEKHATVILEAVLAACHQISPKKTAEAVNRVDGSGGGTKNTPLFRALTVPVGVSDGNLVGWLKTGTLRQKTVEVLERYGAVLDEKMRDEVGRVGLKLWEQDWMRERGLLVGGSDGIWMPKTKMELTHVADGV